MSANADTDPMVYGYFKAVNIPSWKNELCHALVNAGGTSSDSDNALKGRACQVAERADIICIIDSLKQRVDLLDALIHTPSVVESSGPWAQNFETNRIH